MPKSTTTTLSKDDLACDSGKITARVEQHAKTPDHKGRIHLVTPPAVLDALHDDLEHLLVSAPHVWHAISNHVDGTTYKSDVFIKALLTSVYLWLLAAVASKALSTEYRKGLDRDQAPQLYAVIMKKHRPSKRALSKMVRDEFNSLKPTELAVNWRYTDVLGFVYTLSDLESRAISAENPLPDMELHDKLEDVLNQLQAFSFVVGQLGLIAEADKTFEHAKELALARCEDLRPLTTAAQQPSSYFTPADRNVCTACKRSGHSADRCYKTHPELMAETICGQERRGLPCQRPSCSFKHTTSETTRQRRPTTQSNLVLGPLAVAHGAAHGATYAFNTSGLTSPPGLHYFDAAPAPAPEPASTSTREPPRYQAPPAHTDAKDHSWSDAARHRYDAVCDTVELLRVHGRAIVMQPTFALGGAAALVLFGLLSLALMVTGRL
jgi:hypothetical protein